MTETGFLAVIPARGGSKGLPGKNLRPFHGRSLVGRAVAIGVAVPSIVRVVVSSDDPDILEEGEAAGAIPLRRPCELARDESLMVDVLEHAVGRARQWWPGWEFEGLVSLQPTAVLRRAEHVSAAIDHWRRVRACRTLHCLHTVTRVPDKLSGPWWHHDESGRLRRSGLEPRAGEALVFRNGAAVVLDPGFPPALTAHEGVVEGLVTDDIGVSIDDARDFARAEAMFPGDPTGAYP